jgi:transcriptional regulator with XRE-family HTH domain
MSRFSERLRELRIAKGYTQQDIADKIHVNKQTISQYERGVRQPQIEVLEQLADVFNVDMNYLLGKEDLITRLINSDEYALLENYRTSSSEKISSLDRDIIKAFHKADIGTQNAVCKLLDIKGDLVTELDA